MSPEPLLNWKSSWTGTLGLAHFMQYQKGPKNSAHLKKDRLPQIHSLERAFHDGADVSPTACPCRESAQHTRGVPKIGVPFWGGGGGSYNQEYTMLVYIKGTPIWGEMPTMHGALLSVC